jgi:hypothetical protein
MSEDLLSTRLSKKYTNTFNTAPFLSLGDVIGRRGVIFIGNFIGKPLSLQKNSTEVDNEIVLAAAFIQAFSTGIPMFMVILSTPASCNVWGSNFNCSIGWTLLLGIWLCSNVAASIHLRSCSNTSSWSTCGIIRRLFPVWIRFRKYYR